MQRTALPKQETLRFGAVELRVGLRQLVLDGEAVPVGARAFDLLHALAARQGEVVAKAELLAAAWPGVTVDDNNLQVQIRALRKVLGADAIATVPGRGYQLTLDGAAAAATNAEPLLAVLPFDNLSNDPEMQFFSDGISEEIIQRIARGSSLKVIGRTSSFRFTGAHKTEAVRVLKCTHIVDGSIRRAAGRVRIAVHLVEAATNTTLWSDRYDRSLDDIFAVQDEIAERLSIALKSAFSRAGAAPVDSATYDLFLRAIRPDLAPERILSNIALLEEVTRRAPDFADAWGKLAQRRAFLHYFVPYRHRGEVQARIAAEAGEALKRDPHNPAARMAEYLLLPPFGEFIAAEDAVKRIMSDAPSDAYGLVTGAVHLQGVGRIREAVELCERAYELDAFDPIVANYWGQCLFVAGRYDEARARLEQVYAQFPDVQGVAMLLMLVCAHQKDWAAVERMTEPAQLAKFPLREFERVVRLVAAMRAGIDGARQSIDAARRRVRKTGRLNFDAVVYAAHLGAGDEIYDVAAQATFGPAQAETDTLGIHAYRTSILFYAPYAELRRDRRFVDLCARAGLVEYWMASGHWPDCAAELAPAYDFRAECERAARAVAKQRFDATPRDRA